MGRPRTWSDDDLVEAAQGASSMAEVVRRLRLSRGGAAYVTVRTRMEQLGLVIESPARSVGAAPGQARDGRSWTEEQLFEAVAQACSLNDVFGRIGLVVGGSQWLVIRSVILERGWSTSHWNHPLDASDSITAEVPRTFREALAAADLDALVARSRSRADVIRALGFSPSSTTYRLLRDALRARTMSVAHFDKPHQAMRRSRRSRYRTPLEEILVAGSSYTSIDTLKRRLVDAALLEDVCAVCGIDTWCGMPITLHLDHVNGVRNDHRLENLRFLCPNCHSQTATFSGRNKGRYGAGPRC